MIILFLLAGILGYLIGYVCGGYHEWMGFYRVDKQVEGVKTNFRFIKNKVIRGADMCYICHTPIYANKIGMSKKGKFHFHCKKYE